MDHTEGMTESRLQQPLPSRVKPQRKRPAAAPKVREEPPMTRARARARALALALALNQKHHLQSLLLLLPLLQSL